jgi:two-component system copper resistance phosphate regulon response regulator CusR
MPESANVLLVSGDRSLAREVVEYFQQNGIAMDVARDGPRGLAMALVGGYSLVISDVVLEGFDGFSLLDSIRQQMRVPVLMLSKPLIPQPGDRSPIKADDYAPRPIALNNLYEKAAALIRVPRRRGA